MNIPKTTVIIPAYNEEQAIGHVIDDIPKEIIAKIIVVDNGSNDNTAQNAENAGAFVVREEKRGYGQACLKGIENLPADTEIVVFLDGDYSDYPEDMIELLKPIVNDKADMTLGSRIIGERKKGALMIHSSFGNRLASFLIKLFWGFRFTDLGPFRAIKYQSLKEIGMKDTNFGWTVEMQIKAVINKLRIVELPVRYKKRIGQSKITGTVRGSIKAGLKITYTIIKYRITTLFV